MASKNVTTALAVYDSFNKRDLDAAVSSVAENIVVEDHGLGVTHKSRAEFRDSLQSWITGFSDGQVTEPKAIDAGDTVIIQYVGRGTNDGPMGPFQQPTGRKVSVPFCDIYQFDAKGQIVRGQTYFDMLSMLVQLGHAERPAAK
ncbi:MAG: ester cyclase [Actinomycetota bacterium]